MKIKIKGMYHRIVFHIFVQPKPYISGQLVHSKHGHWLFYYHTGLANLHFSGKITMEFVCFIVAKRVILKL